MTTIPGEAPERLEATASAVNEDTGTDASSADNTVAASTTETGKDVGALLTVDSLENPEHQRTIHAALTFVESPLKKSVEDIADVATSVSNVIGDYMQENQDPPAIVHTVHNRLELLSRQTYIASAEAELAKDEPDLMVLLQCMRMASMNAVTLPAEMQVDIALLRQEIDIRNLDNPIYNRMCELSVVVGEAITHLSSAKAIATANILRGSLTSGALPESIKTGLSLLPKLRTDAGKNDQESQAALQEIADRIAAMMAQLEATQAQ